jgi:AcrR family transcriptional regulator
MAQKPKKTEKDSRLSLTREGILEAALELADRDGIEKLTMRRLAEHLGSAPMSMYYHIPSKDRLIDAMVESVFARIRTPPEELPWTPAIRVRFQSARAVLTRHWWAPPLMESRRLPGPENLRHHNAVIGCFRRAGFSLELCAHAYAVLDSYLYGFAFEEASLPSQSDGGMQDIGGSMMDELRNGGFEHLAELAGELVLKPGYSFGDSFEFGLDLILDGLERAMRNEVRRR